MTAVSSSPLRETYNGLRVLVTGHTGFKGSWLCQWLSLMGAEVAGYSDMVPTDPAGFDFFGKSSVAQDNRGDIRDVDAIRKVIDAWKPALILHLAAQPIVRLALREPLDTFGINVMGTAAVLEAARMQPSVKAALIVTSDKVYSNDNTGRAFVETDPLGGHEPYGASKAAAEIVAATYRSAGFHRGGKSRNMPHVATARAGNVIGGGDWAADRLIPDAIRAIASGQSLTIRSPNATRPWQHVLEPVGGYLLMARALLASAEKTPAAVNFGPDPSEVRTVESVIRQFQAEMEPWHFELIVEEDKSGAEAKSLMVDSSLAHRSFGWSPAWTASEAVCQVAAWHRAHLAGEVDLKDFTAGQIAAYCEASTVAAFKN